MSMLSAQCDELRTMAESVGLAMPQAATLMMEAADTIWELRGSVHRERAEADRLRELVDGWDFCSKTKSSTFDNCVGCPLFIQTPHSYRCARDERMRELGIEVD